MWCLSHHQPVPPGPLKYHPWSCRCTTWSPTVPPLVLQVYHLVPYSTTPGTAGVPPGPLLYSLVLQVYHLVPYCTPWSYRCTTWSPTVLPGPAGVPPGPLQYSLVLQVYHLVHVALVYRVLYLLCTGVRGDQGRFDSGRLPQQELEYL